jgi:hypothetical protein
VLSWARTRGILPAGTWPIALLVTASRQVVVASPYLYLTKLSERGLKSKLDVITVFDARTGTDRHRYCDRGHVRVRRQPRADNSRRPEARRTTALRRRRRAFVVRNGSKADAALSLQSAHERPVTHVYYASS